MILTDLPPGTLLFRAHAPQWADRPLSGAGAARQGGRFNREGVEALYLSLEALTALREYQQTSPFLPPCTMCSYTAALCNLVDLRQLHHGEPWDALWHDWREDWRYLKLELNVEPPSWVLSDLVLAHGGSNFVVYMHQLKAGDWIKVNDPDRRLPRDQSSWA